MPTFIGVMKNSTESLDFYSRMIWVVIMYLIGGYIRIYDIKLFKKKKNVIISALISSLILFSSIGIIYFVKNFIPQLIRTCLSSCTKQHNYLDIKCFNILSFFKNEYWL